MTRSHPPCCEELYGIAPRKGENCGCSEDRPPLRKPSDFCQCRGINSINVGSAKRVVKDLNTNALITSLRPGYGMNCVEWDPTKAGSWNKTKVWVFSWIVTRQFQINPTWLTLLFSWDTPTVFLSFIPVFCAFICGISEHSGLKVTCASRAGGVMRARRNRLSLTVVRALSI